LTLAYRRSREAPGCAFISAQPLFQDAFISRLRAGNSIVRHRAAFIPIFREKRETYRTRQAPRSASAGAGCAGKVQPPPIYRRRRSHEKTETMKFQLSSPGWFQIQRERERKRELSWSRESSEISPDACEAPAEK